MSAAFRGVVENRGGIASDATSAGFAVDGVPAAQRGAPDDAPGQDAVVRVPFPAPAGVHALRAEMLLQGAVVGARATRACACRHGAVVPMRLGAPVPDGRVVLLAAAGGAPPARPKAAAVTHAVCAPPPRGRRA